MTLDVAALIREILVGVGVLLVGLGIFILCTKIGAVLTRLLGTLDVIDREVVALSAPVTTTLAHVGGIAGTADTTIARLGTAVGRLEDIATSASSTANLIGTTVAGVASGLRKPPRPGAGGLV